MYRRGSARVEFLGFIMDSVMQMFLNLYARVKISVLDAQRQELHLGAGN
jgi:hypothetical protein